MKNVFTFLIFIIYATLIFFAPNAIIFIIIPVVINLIAIITIKPKIKKTVKNLVNLLPFILFTGSINLILEDLEYTIYISIKLILVCNITYIYSTTSTAFTVAKTIKKLCTPLKIFNINIDDIEIVIALGITMIPVLKKELLDLKNACVAKNIQWNIKNMKIILSKFLISLIKRVNEIDEALIEKA